MLGALLKSRPVPAHVRNERIVQLRQETLQQIGDEMGMSQGAVAGVGALCMRRVRDSSPCDDVPPDNPHRLATAR